MNALRQSKRSWACVLLLALLFLSACAGQGESKEETSVPQAVEPVGKVYYAYFDTVSYVYDYAGDSAERFEDRSAEVSHILEEYHKLFDIYHEYSGVVNLCTLNKNAGGEALEVDPKLVEFLAYAKDMYTLTDGEMNVMLGAVRLIGRGSFAAGKRSDLTEPSTLSARAAPCFADRERTPERKLRGPFLLQPRSEEEKRSFDSAALRSG